MKINKNIVLNLEKYYECPILEMCYSKNDGYWYVCFDEWTCIKGENQTVHLNDILEAIKKYDNIEYLTNEAYCGDEEDTFFEQVTFLWKE